MELNPDYLRSGSLDIADAHLAQDNYDQALLHYNEARQIQETPGLLVDIGATYAASGKYEMALTELEKAFTAGYRDFEDIQTDPLFASLREDSRFIDLMRRMKTEP